MKKKVGIALTLVAVAACVIFILQKQPQAEVKSPLDLLMTYEPPKGRYVSPEFLTQGLPAGFSAGTPTIENTAYQDGTPVELKALLYSNELGSVVVVQILDVCGDTFIANTPDLEEYTFEITEVSGKKAVKYLKENVCGYTWYYRGHSITIFTSPAEFPSYLDEFAELYMGEYPSTL